LKNFKRFGLKLIRAAARKAFKMKLDAPKLSRFKLTEAELVALAEKDGQPTQTGEVFEIFTKKHCRRLRFVGTNHDFIKNQTAKITTKEGFNENKNKRFIRCREPETRRTN